jgi:thioredoxin 1
MSTTLRVSIVAALAAVVSVVLISKQRETGQAQAESQQTVATRPSIAPADAPTSLPRLVDLGATKCIPCKMMAPILAELKKEYAGRLDVVFIDVWENRDAGEKYGIQSIPTQIFFDAAGKELFRHEGFFAKADILTKWKELGVVFATATAPAT